MCGMCEAHINDAIRRNFNVKKVKSSHSKGETVIESETEPDAAALKRAIEETGYEFISASTKIIEGRRGLFAGILHKDQKKVEKVVKQNGYAFRLQPLRRSISVLL